MLALILNQNRQLAPIPNGSLSMNTLRISLLEIFFWRAHILPSAFPAFLYSAVILLEALCGQ